MKMLMLFLANICLAIVVSLPLLLMWELEAWDLATRIVCTLAYSFVLVCFAKEAIE